MSQATDYVLSNQSGAAFRAELNSILAAIVSANSGATEPATTYAFMPWADTSSGILKLRNAANDGWVNIGTMDDVGLGLLSRAGGVMTGLLNTAKGDDVASAATLPLINDGNYFDVTGTTTITAFASLGVGSWIGLHFDGILTLTHNATDLILPSGANITTAAGDEAIFVEYASGDWRCVSYTRASGEALVGGVTFANAATFNAGTNETEALNSKIVRENAWVYLAKQNATSGSSIDFTGIPSWATEIEMMGTAVSTNGTSGLVCVLGDSAGFETSGYSGQNSRSAGTGAVMSPNSASFIIQNGVAAASAYEFNIRLSKYDDNEWTISASSTASSGAGFNGSITNGNKTLSDTLTQVAFRTADTFDGAGTIRVRYR